MLKDWYRYGRRYGFLGATLLEALGSVMSAISINPYMYAVARFLCGAGVTSKCRVQNDHKIHTKIFA